MITTADLRGTRNVLDKASTRARFLTLLCYLSSGHPPSSLSPVPSPHSGGEPCDDEVRQADQRNETDEGMGTAAVRSPDEPDVSYRSTCRTRSTGDDSHDSAYITRIDAGIARINRRFTGSGGYLDICSA